MYLVDTNVWLERLLGRAASPEAGELLDRTPTERLFLTDFAFHSIGVVLHRLNRVEALPRFVQDVFVDAGVQLVRLDPPDMPRLVAVVRQFRLDFDDAYQYVAADKHDLVIVSFDGVFDRTARGRRRPGEVTGS